MGDHSDPSTGTGNPATDDAVTLRLFGTPRLVHGPASTPLPGNRRSQLLGSLAVSGEWIPRGRLALLLWPDAAPAAARVNLRNLLLRLRRWLATQGGPTVEERADALRWTGPTDVRSFWAAIAREDWATALANADGELLDGLDTDGADTWLDWVAAERERVDRAWRRAALAQAQRLQGRPRECEALAERMLARDPCDEDAAALHVHALAALHGDAAAHAAADRFVDRLRRTLGAEPTWTWSPPGAAGPGSGSPAPPQEAWIDRPALEAVLARWLDDGHPLGVLVGPPGMGKSALARHVASSRPSLWLSAAGAANGEALDLRLAAALAAGRSLGSSVPQSLLVVDEVEGVGDIEAWLARQRAAAPARRLLVTSRRQLALPGARVLAVGPLTLQEGRALFAASAHRQAPQVDLSAQPDAVDAIVHHLDGCALAVELAAAWLRHWSPAAVADAMRAPLDLLGEDTLRASIDRSWRALAEPLQAALARLAWLPGPCSLTYAQLAGGVHAQQVRALLDQSLVRGTTDGGIDLHALVRARVRELTPDQRDAVERRQLAAVASQCRRAWPGVPMELVVGSDAVQLEAAWERALQDADADRLEAMVDALRTRHGQHGALASGLTQLQRALRAVGAAGHTAPTAAATAALMGGCADLLTRAQRLAEAEAQARSALRLARTVRRTDLARQAVHALGAALLRQGRPAHAGRCFAEAARLAQAIGDAGRAALALNAQGTTLLALNRPTEAAVAHREAIGQLTQIGAAPLAFVGAWVNLCIARRAVGDTAGALEAARQAVAQASQAHARVDRSMAEAQLAICHIAAGEGRQALAVVQAARDALDDPAQSYASAVLDVAESRARTLLGQAEAAAAPLRQRLSPESLAADAGEVTTSMLETAAHWAARFGRPALADALARFVAAHPAFPATDRAGLIAWRRQLDMDAAARRNGAALSRRWSNAGPAGLAAAAAAARAALATATGHEVPQPDLPG